MPQALPLTDLIAQGSNRTVKPRVKKAQFGGGYAQTAPDGINPFVESWSIQYIPLTTSERSTMWAALFAVGGWDYLTWQPPGDTAKKWKVVGDITETPASGDLYTLAFTLERCY